VDPGAYTLMTGWCRHGVSVRDRRHIRASGGHP
jgi:hypothetical protein